MPSLNLIHSGNMNITSANLSSAGTLDVRYEPNNTGAVTGFTFSPPEGSEFVCGETYTITAVPKFSGNVLTETFVVSGVDVAGVPRSDNSVLRQGFDSNLTHYGLSLSSLGATILDSSVTSTYLEVVIRLDNDEYAEIDIQPEGGDVFVYPIDNISGGDVPVVLATSITIVVESAITDSGIATAEYSPDNATVQLSYSSSNPNLATINPYTGQITVLADGVVQFCVTDSVSSLSDCKTVTVEKSPEPGVTGITSLTLSVAEEIVGTGIAIPVYSPSGAEVSLVFTSSNPSLATIDSGGNITVLDNGQVTFCVTDELSGLRDCKTVSVRKAVYIDDIVILVDDNIYLQGVASAEYHPSNGTVSLIYSSSNPEIASIDAYTGVITVHQKGIVTFCVRDVYTNLSDCKTVNAYMEEGLYLTFNILTDGYLNYTRQPMQCVYYSLDSGTTWVEFSDSNNYRVRVYPGNIVYIKGTGFPEGDADWYQGAFSNNTCSFDIKGNIMSLFYGDNFLGKTVLPESSTMIGLFANCTGLTDASKLIIPVTSLSNTHSFQNNGCFANMFQGCTSLTTAPELPATTLATECYKNMFAGCTSLTTAPASLPATTLADSCYESMFSGCTSLTTAPELPAATLAVKCYAYMFRDCSGLTTGPSSIGTSATTIPVSACTSMFRDCTSLTTAPELPATTLASNCYYQMFYGCTSLTTTPELPATTLANNCYSRMFGGCTSLTTLPSILPATTLAGGCYANMFWNCTSLTTTPALPATTLVNGCYAGMFSRCASLITAPELPARTLATSCYGLMFNGCTSLTTAPELPATTLATECYNAMFRGCTSLTTAPVLPATSLTSNCYQEMFKNCSSLNYIKCLAKNRGDTYSLMNWVYGVAVNGTFVKNPSMSITSWTYGPDGIPSMGWTVQDAS